MHSNIAARNNGFTTSIGAPSCLLIATVMLPAAGCQQHVDQYADALTAKGPVTTASVEGARAAQVVASPRQRAYKLTEVRAIEHAVKHSPLYFSDPAEGLIDDDPTVAWSGGDFLSVVYGSGHFLASTALFPVSALLEPPWAVRVSDGRPSRPWLGVTHDDKARSGPNHPPPATPHDSKESSNPSD